jgi:hypothetical protein
MGALLYVYSQPDVDFRLFTSPVKSASVNPTRLCANPSSPSPLDLYLIPRFFVCIRYHTILLAASQCSDVGLEVNCAHLFTVYEISSQVKMEQ